MYRWREVLNHFLTRKRLPIIAVVSIFLLGISIWAWIIPKNDSNYVFHQFVSAVEQKDISAIYSLTLDEEKSKLGVTKEVIARVLNETVYKHTDRVKYISSSLDRYYYGRGIDQWQKRAATWADAATGKPIASPHISGQLQTIVEMFLSRDGQWRVSFTRFAASYIVMNITRPQLERKGVKTEEDIRQAREYQQRILVYWGIKKMLPSPPITRIHGRTVVVERKQYEGRINP